jgi:hypothetical protein
VKRIEKRVVADAELALCGFDEPGCDLGFGGAEPFTFRLG